MSITHNSNIVTNLSPNGVSGWLGDMGLHRLRFSVQYQTPARTEIFVARNFRATVTVSRSHEGGAYLGIAWPESAWTLRTGTSPLPRYSGPAGIVRQRYVSDEPVEPDPEHLVARREFEARPENRIVVSDTLDMPHPLVAARGEVSELYAAARA